MIVVALTCAEFDAACSVGYRRQQAAIHQQRVHRTGNRALPWNVGIVGALGECAVARWLGVAWTPNIGGRDSGGDVGPGRQVRSTSRADGGLCVYGWDDPEHRFVLVYVEPWAHRCTIVGWLYGHEARRPEWRRGASYIQAARWEVPRSALRVAHPVAEMTSA